MRDEEEEEEGAGEEVELVLELPVVRLCWSTSPSTLQPSSPPASVKGPRSRRRSRWRTRRSSSSLEALHFIYHGTVSEALLQDLDSLLRLLSIADQFDIRKLVLFCAARTTSLGSALSTQDAFKVLSLSDHLRSQRVFRSIGSSAARDLVRKTYRTTSGGPALPPRQHPPPHADVQRVRGQWCLIAGTPAPSRPCLHPPVPLPPVLPKVPCSCCCGSNALDVPLRRCRPEEHPALAHGHSAARAASRGGAGTWGLMRGKKAMALPHATATVL